MIKNTFTNPQIQTSAYAQKPILIPTPPVVPNISRILGDNILNNLNPLSRQLLSGSLNNSLTATQANNPATSGKSQAAWTNAGGCGCGSKGCGNGGGDKAGTTGQTNSGNNNQVNNKNVDPGANNDNLAQNQRNINTPQQI